MTVYAWALLSNHYHVALRTSAAPLSRTMQYLQGTFSRSSIEDGVEPAPRWQSRYQTRVIDDQRYFDQVIVYVHLSPVRAGLADGPADHVFSGHRELMGRIKNSLVDVDNALIGFGDSLRTAQKQYSARVRAGMEEGKLVVPQCGLGLLWERDRDLDASEPVFIDELGRSAGLERPNLDVAQYLEHVCSILNIALERLASSRREPPSDGSIIAKRGCQPEPADRGASRVLVRGAQQRGDHETTAKRSRSFATMPSRTSCSTSCPCA